MTSSSLLGSSKKDLLTEYTESKRQWSIFDYPLGQPFYLLNGAVILTYLPVRYFLLTDLNDQPIDYLGLTREQQIYLILLFIGVSRYHKFVTLPAFVSYMIMILRVAIIFITYTARVRVATSYAVAFTCIYVVLRKTPGAKMDKSPVEATLSTFTQRVLEDRTMTYHLVLFYTPWASESVFFQLTFQALMQKYGSQHLRFWSVNVEKYNTLGQDFSLDVSIYSKSLPTVMLFSQGKPVPLTSSAPTTTTSTSTNTATAANAGVNAHVCRLPRQGQSVSRATMSEENIANTFQLQQRSLALI